MSETLCGYNVPKCNPGRLSRPLELRFDAIDRPQARGVSVLAAADVAYDLDEATLRGLFTVAGGEPPLLTGNWAETVSDAEFRKTLFPHVPSPEPP